MLCVQFWWWVVKAPDAFRTQPPESNGQGLCSARSVSLHRTNFKVKDSVLTMSRGKFIFLKYPSFYPQSVWTQIHFHHTLHTAGAFCTRSDPQYLHSLSSKWVQWGLAVGALLPKHIACALSGSWKPRRAILPRRQYCTKLEWQVTT